MKLSEFDFNLPEELIAQTPLDKRDSSKLLVLDKETGEIKHHHFSDIINYLNEGDVLVLTADNGSAEVCKYEKKALPETDKAEAILVTKSEEDGPRFL